MASPEFASYIESLPSGSRDRPIAFFDLDGTLIAGYSIVALARETVKKNLTDGEWQQSAKLMRDLVLQRTRRAGSNYHRLVRRLSRALEGMRESALEDLGQSAYHHFLARQIYPEAVALVEAHRRAGHTLVLLTSASRYQAEPVARVLGIDNICCTRLEVENGQFTGKVLTPMCFGEGKALAARRIARQQGTSLKNAWFYTDSSADLPLLRSVGHPVAVNPSERLAQQAERNEWPMLRFRSRGGADLGTLARTSLTTQSIMATSMLGQVSRRLGVGDRDRANGLTRLLGSVAGASAGLKLSVEGEHHLRANRPCIFIFNHQSLLDAVVLAQLLKQDVVAFCKREMAEKPIIGPLLKQVDTIFVDRENRDQSEVLQQALDVLAGGRSLVIAPEGTRSTLGDLQPFKQGAFYLAKKARVPIVPIVLHNVKDALPKGGLLVRPATVRISVLDPVAPGDLGSIREVSARLQALYRSELSGSPEAALPYQARESAIA
jgi:putative phosphoserine phosphatase/1-acylglycerol-3-phosphate O-acyltransferase